MMSEPDCHWYFRNDAEETDYTGKGGDPGTIVDPVEEYMVGVS
jgi:hypothetical protein